MHSIKSFLSFLLIALFQQFKVLVEVAAMSELLVALPCSLRIHLYTLDMVTHFSLRFHICCNFDHHRCISSRLFLLSLKWTCCIGNAGGSSWSSSWASGSGGNNTLMSIWCPCFINLAWCMFITIACCAHRPFMLLIVIQVGPVVLAEMATTNVFLAVLACLFQSAVGWFTYSFPICFIT